MSVKPRNEYIINPLFKDTVTFLTTASETNGVYSECEVTLMPGGGNPPHIHHRFVETFKAIQGQLGLKTLILEPGDSFPVPIGTVHNFFNPGHERILFKIRFEPGFEGFNQMLRILYGLARDGKTNKKGIPNSLAAIAIAGELGDTQLPGLWKLVAPLLRLIADRARRNGLEQQLLNTYCRDVPDRVSEKHIR